ncbi:VPLPA-CTERM sorting domain-containing protein [uncultured Roseibium sp.]|uniref:VPLPA-CTERM sorting domain-containing protein n=1 Tax=uncultured Roseibium sp. TaxID=1936171 RepID=UPI00262C63F7|nr:VPLPA-CTERM sorting domain-containing protein [uncultured Roseibium sp.]
MKYLRALALLTLLITPNIAHTAPINLSDFSGSEKVIDFESSITGLTSGVFSIDGVNFISHEGAYTIPYAGGLIAGGSGAAYNTNTFAGNQTTGDLTISFDNAITRFGMNIGIGGGSAILEFSISAFDAKGSLVESAFFGGASNYFVGFDFGDSIEKIVIGRTDFRPGYFTFVDDVRLNETTVVPLPASLPFLAAAIGGLALLRRRGTT